MLSWREGLGLTACGDDGRNCWELNVNNITECLHKGMRGISSSGLTMNCSVRSDCLAHLLSVFCHSDCPKPSLTVKGNPLVIDSVPGS